jgi:hypothetical protein
MIEATISDQELQKMTCIYIVVKSPALTLSDIHPFNYKSPLFLQLMNAKLSF